MLQNVEQETKILEEVSFEFLIDYLQTKGKQKLTPCISYTHKHSQRNIHFIQYLLYEGELMPTAIPSIYTAVVELIKEKKPTINIDYVLEIGELWVQYLGKILLFKREKKEKEVIYSISLKHSVPDTRLSRLVVIQY